MCAQPHTSVHTSTLTAARRVLGISLSTSLTLNCKVNLVEPITSHSSITTFHQEKRGMSGADSTERWRFVLGKDWPQLALEVPAGAHGLWRGTAEGLKTIGLNENWRRAVQPAPAEAEAGHVGDL